MQAKLPTLVALAVVASASPAFAGRVDFNLSGCKDNPNRRLYVALGHTVISVPGNGYGGFMSADPKKRLPPPDPSDPEGCPGNPLQAILYSFFITPKLPPNGPAGPSSSPAIALRVILYPTEGDDGTGKKAEWLGEGVVLEIMRSDCNSSSNKIDDQSIKGFRACLIPRKDMRTPPKDWGGVYVAHSDVYRTPLGKPFVVSCYPRIFVTKQCQVAYDTGSVDLSYHLPEAALYDRAIIFDRAVRAQIDADIDRKYKWPNSNTATHNPSFGGTK